MARPITFSRYFPKTHPKSGEPTYFVEKLWTEWGYDLCTRDLPGQEIRLNNEIYRFLRNDFKPKLHTIRAGKHWKTGDIFSPRIWSDRPYASPQIIIGPDMPFKRVADIEINENGVIVIDGKTYSCEPQEWHPLAMNDGLSNQDLADWFRRSLPFSGQILIWTNKELPY